MVERASGCEACGGLDAPRTVIDDAAVVARANDLGRRLAASGGLVATAESCTGGLIARALTETAGSSAWFDRGFVTYSNESKVDLIGVRLSTLGAHGAVSEPVAREMAVGALKHSQAVMALSVTGIAGPGGAVPGKPVGLVCFGWALALPQAGPADLVVVESWLLAGDRATVRLQAAHLALVRGLALLESRLASLPAADERIPVSPVGGVRRD